VSFFPTAALYNRDKFFSTRYLFRGHSKGRKRPGENFLFNLDRTVKPQYSVVDIGYMLYILLLADRRSRAAEQRYPDVNTLFSTL
jgi:hypothetical protein